MLFKSATLLILALFSLQISTQEISISEAIFRLSLLRDTGTRVLNDVFGKYRAFLEKFDSVAVTTKSTATLAIRTYSEEYLQRFTDLSKSAAEANVDITTCVNIAGDELKNLGPENTENLVACINKNADDGVDHVRSRGDQIARWVLDLVFDSEKQVVHCGEVDRECLHQAINSIPEMDIGVAVSRDESYFEAFVSRIEGSCRDRYTQTTRDKGEHFLQVFEDCVDFYTNNTVH